jgi:hypothetical protein
MAYLTLSSCRKSSIKRAFSRSAVLVPLADPVAVSCCRPRAAVFLVADRSLPATSVRSYRLRLNASDSLPSVRAG